MSPDHASPSIDGVASPPRHPWFWLAVIWTALGVWGIVDVYQRGKVDPVDASLHKTDLTVYTEAGAAFFDGRQPYEVTNPRGWGYLYLPLFAMLLAPLHALPGEWQVTVWFFISLAVLAGFYFECMRLARLAAGSRPAGDLFPPWLIRASVGAFALPAFNCLQRGQIGVLQLYLMLLGLRVAIESGHRLRGQFVAGAILAAPIGLKLTPALPVACYWFHRLCGAVVRREPSSTAPDSRRWSLNLPRLFGVAAGGAGVCAGLALWILVLPALLIGWQANLERLDQWRALVGSKAGRQTYDRFAGDSYSVRNQSLSNALHHLGNWAAYEFAGGPYDEPFENEGTHIPEFVTDTLPFEIFIRAAQFGVMAVAVWLCWRGAQTDDIAWRIAAFGLACVAMLIASPIARAHYFVSLIPATLFLPAALLRVGRRSAAMWMAWIPFALVMAHYALMRIVGRVGLLGIGITIWFLCGSALLASLVSSPAAKAGAADPNSLRPRLRERRSELSGVAPRLTA